MLPRKPAGFAKAAPDHGSRSFYRALCGTQLWADFVRDLTFISERNSDLEVFDQCIAAQDDGGSSALSLADSGSGSDSLGFTPAYIMANGTVPSLKGCSGRLDQTDSAASLTGLDPR